MLRANSLRTLSFVAAAAIAAAAFIAPASAAEGTSSQPDSNFLLADGHVKWFKSDSVDRTTTGRIGGIAVDPSDPSAASAHPGGVNVALADGSVR